MSEPTLKARAIRGSLWTLGAFGTSRVLRLSSHLILAWMLAPEIFGLMALVKVFMHGLEMFSDIGIGPSIIQSKRGHDPAFLNTAWTIGIIRGFALWIITCLIAYPFAWFYAQNDPAAWQLLYLLPTAAFSAVIAGFNSTALTTLNKELHLGRVTMLLLATQVVSLTVMISWALVHPTVWALIAGGMAGTLFHTVLSHFLAFGHKVRIGWDQDCSRELFRFGKWIFLSTIFTFLAINIDKLILGKLLTLSELGIYGIALVFAKVALDVASRLSNKVMFPLYAKIQDNSDRLMKAALRAREAVLWAGAAVCIAFAVGSPLFFETLWDPRYHEAGVIGQWLAVYIWARIIMQTMDRIPLALGNSKAVFFSNIIQTGGIVSAMIGFWGAGLAGFIVGLAIGPLLSHLFLLGYLPARRNDMLWQSVRFTLMVGLIGLGAVGLTNWIRTVHSTPIWITAVILVVTLPLLVTTWVIYNRVFNEKHQRI